MFLTFCKLLNSVVLFIFPMRVNVESDNFLGSFERVRGGRVRDEVNTELLMPAQTVFLS